MAEAPPFQRSASLPLDSPPGLGPAGSPPQEDHAAGRRLPTRLSVWLPATAVVASVGAVLGWYGVSLSDLGLFSLYVVFCCALPGVLWIRALYRRAHTLPEEIALGVTLGYALEALAHMPARAIGAPLLVVAWPIGTYVLFLAVPRLRGRWRSESRTGGTPLWWSWSVAVIVICLILWTAIDFFGTQALTRPAITTSSVDTHAHLAAAGWITEMEPLVLLSRLAALVVLLGAVGRRITGSRGGALAALAGTVFVAAPGLYAGTGAGPVRPWMSPSQAFGALLFAPIVLLLLDLLGDRRRSRGHWVLLAVMLLAVVGAKAIYLPLLAAGLAAVVMVETARRFWLPRRALAALGMTVGFLVFARLVPFGGARQGADPLSIRHGAWGDRVGVSEAAELPWAFPPGVTLLGGLITWCGMLGLLHRPRLFLRSSVVLVLGMSAAVLGFGHSGLSQGDFLQTGRPYLAMVTVAGLAAIVRRAGVTVGAVVCAVVTGVAAVLAIRLLCDVRVPLAPGQDDIVLYVPYVALLGVALLAVAVLRVARQSRLRTMALVLCLVTAAGTPAAWFARVLPGTSGSPEAGVRLSNGTAPSSAQSLAMTMLKPDVAGGCPPTTWSDLRA
ncbi:hypothetical protein [Nonomuraea sp. NPDC049141]|uniref:hypothetical protein n=1 Tax=Nonomuraea sp. NPDC049141 TaxID=3155500 RepID=UPI00340C2530